MGNESLAALDRGADEPPRLWLCHMLPDACLANPISPPHIACNWTGKTAEPSGHSCSLVRKGSWNKLALALRRAGTTGLPPRGRGGGGVQPARPSSAVPTSTSTPGRAELMCAQPGSAEAASASHNSHPSPSPSFTSQSHATGEAHPIHSNIWVVSGALMTISQMREQTSSARSSLLEATAGRWQRTLARWVPGLAWPHPTRMVAHMPTSAHQP